MKGEAGEDKNHKVGKEAYPSACGGCFRLDLVPSFLSILVRLADGGAASASEFEGTVCLRALAVDEPPGSLVWRRVGAWSSTALDGVV